MTDYNELHKWENGIFLGMPMRQRYSDLYLWEQFFDKYPIKTMIELGTGNGALSIFFALQAVQHDFCFETFDIAKPEYLNKPLAQLIWLEESFHLGDIFEEMKPDVLKILTDKTAYPHPLLLFCDDGWKPREVQTFSPYLSKGDYLAAHDWETEIYAKDIPVDILDDISPPMPALTRWFIRK